MNEMLVRSLIAPCLHPINGTACSIGEKNAALERMAKQQRNPRKARWMTVDWSKTDVQIACELSVHTGTVVYQRQKALGPAGRRRASVIRIPQPEVTAHERAKARVKLNDAVRLGRISRKPCAVCDCAEVQAHHFDYTRPLEVIWLCSAHHAAVHGNIIQEPRS